MMALLIGVLALLPAQQASPQPTGSRWVLRADPARCLLERQNVDPPSTLSIDTTPGSDTYRVAIANGNIKGFASLAPASLTVDPSRQAIKGLASVAKLPDTRMVIWMDGVPPAFLDNLADAGSVAISARSGAMASAPVAAPAEAIAALRDCIADQLTDWGADTAQFAPGGTGAVAIDSRDDWLSTKDVMTIVGRSSQPDIDAIFRVAVSADGVIDDCRAVDEKIEDGVQKTACAAVLGKRLFNAAKDAGGRPVRSAATFRVDLARRPS